MARVEFKENQPIQSLSGSIGNIEFRTINGKTFVLERQEPELPKDATRKQKAMFRRRKIINQCVSILQNEMEDIQAAIAMRSKLRDRIRYLYDKYSKEISAPTKLQIKIMGEYREKYVYK